MALIGLQPALSYGYCVQYSGGGAEKAVTAGTQHINYHVQDVSSVSIC
jgi:hypothetical protein